MKCKEQELFFSQTDEINQEPWISEADNCSMVSYITCQYSLDNTCLLDYIMAPLFCD